MFSNFSCRFLNSNIFSNLNSNCSNLLDMRNLQEQVEKAFCYQNCSDLSLFEYRISANSCLDNYSFFELLVRPLFKGDNYSREETIRGNTVFPLDAYMVSCPTWSKNLGGTLLCMYLYLLCSMLHMQCTAIVRRTWMY